MEEVLRFDQHLCVDSDELITLAVLTKKRCSDIVPRVRYWTFLATGVAGEGLGIFLSVTFPESRQVSGTHLTQAQPI